MLTHLYAKLKFFLAFKAQRCCTVKNYFNLQEDFTVMWKQSDLLSETLAPPLCASWMWTDPHCHAKRRGPLQASTVLPPPPGGALVPLQPHPETLHLSHNIPVSQTFIFGFKCSRGRKMLNIHKVVLKSNKWQHFLFTVLYNWLSILQEMHNVNNSADIWGEGSLTE